MTDSIKITSLNPIGANIAYTTLIPVVNMAGTPITQKATAQVLGNLILEGAGGSYFPAAAQSILAQAVTNAAQPNITSVGTLTSLAVTGNITAGNVNGGNIVVANFFYGDGGFLTNVAANGSYSNSNVANYLPTYTGNIGAGNVSVTGITNLGAVANVRISGGSSGQVLTTNGSSGLSWTTVSGGGSTGNITFSNTTISTSITDGNINIIGSTSGNVHVDSNNHIFLHVDDSVDPHGGLEMTWARTSAGVTQTAGISVNTDFGNTELATGNVQVVACSNLANGLANSAWTFGVDGSFYLPGIGQKAILTGPNSEMVLHSDTDIRIITDIYDSSRQFIFDQFGDMYTPGNVTMDGTSILVGPGATALGLEGATLVISTTSDSFVQAIVNNVSDIGSADWVAQGHHGNDAAGWADLGFTSASFSDAAYSITGPGDGYVFVQGYLPGQAPAIGNGSLILATGEEGAEKDIIFGTGGFTTANIFGRISDANNALELTRENSSIVFADGTVLGQIEGANTFGFYSNNANMQFLLEASSNNWVFDGATSNLTTPSNLVIGANGAGGSSIYQFDAPLQVIGEGANSTMIMGWTANTSAPGNIAAIGFNTPFPNGASNLVLAVGNNATTVNYWNFATDGTTTFPTLSTQRGDNPSGTITGQTLLFGDDTQEAIISTPDGTLGNEYSQRLVINPGQGYNFGEGGDIYLWAGRGGDGSGSGGDIKIRGGQGGANTTGGSGGSGGYIRMEAGDSATTGGAPGYIDISGGNNYVSAGGYVDIRGGQGQTIGGDANITGGYGMDDRGGNVNIWGGGTGNGQINEGHVNIQTGGNTWIYDSSGNLTLPQGGSIYSVNSTPSGFPGNTITLQPAGSGVTTNQKLMVYPTAGDGDHIHMTSGNLYQTELFLGSDNLYVKLANTGNVVINSNDNTGNTAMWTFGIDGEITLPTGAKLGPAGMGWTGLSGSNGIPIEISTYYSSGNLASQVFSAANGNVDITTFVDGPGADVRWRFSSDGNLTLPGNTFSVNYANGAAVTIPSVGNIATINLDGNSANVLLGSGTFSAVPAAAIIANGNSNVRIATANSDVTIASAGNSVVTITGTGANITGYANVSGNVTSGNISTAGQITSTQAGNLSDGGGQLYLNGTGNNRIDFNTNGTGAPTFTTRSAGTKVVLYPSIGAAATDYAIGVNAGTFWSGIPAADAGQFFRWYGGTTEVANLSGTGILTVTGTITTAGVVQTGSFVTGNIPSAITAGAGARAFVTDADSTTFRAAYVGGAGNAVPVFSDGSAWYIG